MQWSRKGEQVPHSKYHGGTRVHFQYDRCIFIVLVLLHFSPNCFCREWDCWCYLFFLICVPVVRASGLHLWSESLTIDCTGQQVCFNSSFFFRFCSMCILFVLQDLDSLGFSDS